MTTRDYLLQPRPIRNVVDIVCEKYGITRAEFLDRRRRPRVYVQARQEAAYEARRLGAKLVVIAREFDRDHSTIISNADAYEQRMKEKGESIG